MGADADHDQPLVVAVLDAGLIGGGVLEVAERDLLGLIDLLLGPVHDVDRLAAPEHLDVLTVRDRGQIDLDRRAGRDRRGVRIHLGDEGPERGQTARRRRRRLLQRKGNHGVSDGPPKTLSSRFQTLSQARSRWNRPERRPRRQRDRCRRPRPPRRQKTGFFGGWRPNKQSRIVLLAPLPKERKPTIRQPTCNALNPSRPLFYAYIPETRPVRRI